MNDLDKNRDIENVLIEASEETQPNPVFKAELEQNLRAAHKPRTAFSWNWKGLFPTLTGIGALAALAFFMVWLITTLKPEGHVGSGDETPAATPTPGAVIDPNITPEGDSEGGYAFRGGRLFLAAPLPDSPAAANVYDFVSDPPATLEEARTLAEQFEIQGEIYTTASAGLPDQTVYVASDGKRMLTVYTVNYFTYLPDARRLYRVNGNLPVENAEAVIAEFLGANGFDFPYVIGESAMPGMYEVYETAPDGLPIRFDSPSMRVYFGGDGEVVSLDATLKHYDPSPVGEYGIISAQEALDALLDESGNSASFLEMGYSTGYEPPQQWYREYPDNQTVSISGSISSYAAAIPGGNSLYLLDGIPLSGNTDGLESLNDYIFAQATGQFVVENGIRRFVVESLNMDAEPAYVSGSLRSEDGAIILTSDTDGTEYILTDAPADLPLNTEIGVSYLGVSGVIVDGIMDWTNIHFSEDANNMGGGGGGGGAGFRKLNLSGEPMPFPTPIPANEQYTPAEIASFIKYAVQDGDTLAGIAEKFGVTVEELMRVNFITDPSVVSVGWVLTIPGVPAPTRLENARGVAQINLFVLPDGSQRADYWFTTEDGQWFYSLEGENLEALQQFVNRPIAVTGNVRFGEQGETYLEVESFEPLYPGLQFQILKGSQEASQISGNPVVLFTSEGTTYIQLDRTGAFPEQNLYYADGEEVLVEALIVPGETYAGYPAIRVFNTAPAINPVNGKPFDLPIMADKLEPMPDPFGGEPYSQPDLVIERIELAYYAPSANMLYASPSGEFTPDLYVQPVWHFHGRYANGSNIVDFYIQALDREFLSPEYDRFFSGG